jgi:hypothetical protein
MNQVPAGESSQANTNISDYQVKADRGEVEHDKAFQELQERQKAKKAKAT